MLVVGLLFSVFISIFNSSFIDMSDNLIYVRMCDNVDILSINPTTNTATINMSNYSSTCSLVTVYHQNSKQREFCVMLEGQFGKNVKISTIVNFIHHCFIRETF